MGTAQHFQELAMPKGGLRAMETLHVDDSLGVRSMRGRLRRTPAWTIAVRWTPTWLTVEDVGSSAFAIDGNGACGIDAPLGCHRMCASRAVMEAEHFDPIALLRQRRSGRSACQACSHNQHIHLPFA